MLILNPQHRFGVIKIDAVEDQLMVDGFFEHQLQVGKITLADIRHKDAEQRHPVRKKNALATVDPQQVRVPHASGIHRTLIRLVNLPASDLAEFSCASDE
ncbi:MAG: hypothetical protein R2832_19565 [Rhodothermales bacterium]